MWCWCCCFLFFLFITHRRVKDLSTYLHVVAVMLVNGKDVCLAAVLQVVVLSCSNAELLEFFMQ